MGGKKLPLEQAYFHINNGGFTFRIVEILNKRTAKQYEPTPPGPLDLDDEPPKVVGTQTMHNRRWVFEVRTSHFGSGVTFRFPLGSPVMVRWLIEALERVLARMEAPFDLPSDGLEYAFRNGHFWTRVERVNGEKVEQSLYPDKGPYEEAGGPKEL